MADEKEEIDFTKLDPANEPQEEQVDLFEDKDLDTTGVEIHTDESSGVGADVEPATSGTGMKSAYAEARPCSSKSRPAASSFAETRRPIVCFSTVKTIVMTTAT